MPAPKRMMRKKLRHDGLPPSKPQALLLAGLEKRPGTIETGVVSAMHGAIPRSSGRDARNWRPSRETRFSPPQRAPRHAESHETERETAVQIVLADGKSD